MTYISEENNQGGENKTAAERKQKYKYKRNGEQQHRGIKTYISPNHKYRKHNNESCQGKNHIDKGEQAFLKREDVFRYINLFDELCRLKNCVEREVCRFRYKIK